MDEVVIHTEPLKGVNLAIADKIYNESRKCLGELFLHPSIDDTVLVLKTLTTVASLMEVTKVNNDQRIRGSAKKEIVLYVSRKLVTELVSRLHVDRIDGLFERVSHDFIEIFIDFAKNNKVLHKISVPCSSICSC